MSNPQAFRVSLASSRVNAGKHEVPPLEFPIVAKVDGALDSECCCLKGESRCVLRRLRLSQLVFPFAGVDGHRFPLTFLVVNVNVESNVPHLSLFYDITTLPGPSRH